MSNEFKIEKELEIEVSIDFEEMPAEFFDYVIDAADLYVGGLGELSIGASFFTYKEKTVSLLDIITSELNKEKPHLTMLYCLEEMLSECLNKIDDFKKTNNNI